MERIGHNSAEAENRVSSQAPAATPRGPRILIVRLTALGDVIHGIPVACALRQALPTAQIGWIVEGRNGDLLEGHPAVDHLIRVPRRWLKSWGAVWQVRRQLRSLRFDATIDLQCLTKSALAARLSGAPRRIGFGGENARELSRLFHTEFVAPTRAHVIDRNLELLRAYGIVDPPVRFDLPERPADAEAAERHLRSLGLAPGGFAILNAGAGWPSKIWPPERYGRLAQKLAASHGLASMAVWGAPSELPLAQEIVAASNGAARLAPPTTILELAALCRRSALFVGSDTGPLHLAVAVGTPSISLHGPSRPEQCGAYGPENMRLQVRYESGSAKQRRRATDAAMREISVDMVEESCGQILARRPARKCG